MGGSGRQDRGRGAVACLHEASCLCHVVLGGGRSSSRSRPPTHVRLEGSSVSGSDYNNKSVDAPCPRGKVTVGGGARISGSGEPYVHLTALAPMDELGYTATAEEFFGHTALPWELTTWAVCAKRPTGLEYVSTSTPFSSAPSQQKWAACPDDKRAIGSGATIAGGDGRVHLVDVRVEEERDTYAQVPRRRRHAFAWSLRRTRSAAATAFLASTARRRRSRPEGLGVAGDGLGRRTQSGPPPPPPPGAIVVNDVRAARRLTR